MSDEFNKHYKIFCYWIRQLNIDLKMMMFKMKKGPNRGLQNTHRSSLSTQN